MSPPKKGPTHERSGLLIFSLESEVVHSGLVQRLQLEDRGTVIAAHPEGDGRRRVVNEYSTDVSLPGKKIIGELTGLGIEPGHAIGPHGAGPDVTVLVRHNMIRRAPRYRHFPFLDRLGFRVEHTDAVGAVFGEPEPVL